MQVEAILPDGSTQIISYVGNFNFNWMTNYIYADDAAPVFPKGTVIHVTAWYDNTKANKNNPDPDQWVGYGDRTVDEMAHAWMNVVLSDRRRISAVGRRAQGAAGDDAKSTAVTPCVGSSPALLPAVRLMYSIRVRARERSLIESSAFHEPPDVCRTLCRDNRDCRRGRGRAAAA